MKSFKIIIAIVLGSILFNCSEDTVVLEVKGKLTGSVIAKATGQPLAGVKITTSPASTTVVTDAEGKFLIKDILIDDYAVQAELNDYVTGFESVTITEGNTSNVAFELSLSTANNKPPLTPLLISPAYEESNVSLGITFVWESSDPNNDILDYTLELRNGTTNERTIYAVGQDTTKTVSNLQLATNYFWQVTVTDNINTPVSSVISTFTTVTSPDNDYLFVKNRNGNLAIFSGNNDSETGDPETETGILQLTSDNFNSFRPRKNNTAQKIAFLRTVGGAVHIFSMNFDGTDTRQITTEVPVAGFRAEELDFTWANNGAQLYYPYFNKLYKINADGSGYTNVYTTPDGSFISEISVPSFNNDIILIKTNNNSGYNARIFTFSFSTNAEQVVIFENQSGAVGGVNISANGDKVLYNYDISGSINPNYQKFESRIFLFRIGIDLTNEASEVQTDVILGENDLDVNFSASEGGYILTRVGSNFGATPRILSGLFDETTEDRLLFNNAIMPDWK